MLLAKMRANTETYLQDPATTLEGDKLKVLQTFNAGFSIDAYTEEIARLLDEFSEMRDMMNDLGEIDMIFFGWRECSLGKSSTCPSQLHCVLAALLLPRVGH